MSKSIGVVAAHPDDEVLGCGGTLARLARKGYSVHILLIADGESSRVSKESQACSSLISQRISAAHKACEILGCLSVDVVGLPDNRLDSVALLDIVQHIENFINKYKPTKIFTHHSGDVNIDHRIVHDATIVACRPQPWCHIRELFFFEVPSSTEWRPSQSAGQFLPNWFVDISETLALKIQALQAYEAELREFPHPRSTKAIEVLAQWRGVTVGRDAAEAFVLGRKVT